MKINTIGPQIMDEEGGGGGHESQSDTKSPANCGCLPDGQEEAQGSAAKLPNNHQMTQIRTVLSDDEIWA